LGRVFTPNTYGVRGANLFTGGGHWSNGKVQLGALMWERTVPLTSNGTEWMLVHTWVRAHWSLFKIIILSAQHPVAHPRDRPIEFSHASEGRGQLFA